MPTRASIVPRRLRRTSVAMVAAMLAIGFLLTWGAATQAQHMIDQSIGSRMEIQSTILGVTVQDHLAAIERDLHSIEGLFLASESVNRTEFEEFTGHFLTDDAVSGIGYLAIVSAADLAAYGQRMATEIPGLWVHEINEVDGSWIEVQDRPVYYPVEFCTVCGDSLRARGFDFGSMDAHLPYIEDAIEHGPEASHTADHTTASEIGSLPFGLRQGIVVYHHVLDRSGTVQGLAFAEIVLSDIVVTLLAPSDSEHLSWSIRADDPVTPATEVERPYMSSVAISTAGQVWYLDVWPGEGSPILDERIGVYWVIATGMLLTLLIASVVTGRFRRYETTRQIAEMEEILDAKDRFVASVSHELRTPLTAVVGFAEILRDQHRGLSADDRADVIRFISDEATDLANIVDDLLVVARADHGTLRVATRSVDLGDVAARVIETMHLSDRIAIDHVEPQLAAADSERVRQIVRNLVHNATAYGGPNASLTVTKRADTLILSVIDDGPGVPEELAAQIFGPYQTAHSADGNPQSMGLGLYVARTLARRMDGELRYERSGDMTVFELILPAFQGASPSSSGDLLPSGVAAANHDQQ